jgi:hypothetical protein
VKKLLPVLCVIYGFSLNLQANTRLIHLAPIINIDHISPHPRLLMGNDIIIGEGIRGQTFKIPPISYYNGNAKLYYIWFLDGSLVHPQSVINPKNRDEQIINLTIDEQFLLSHFGRIPRDFYDRPHIF